MDMNVNMGTMNLNTTETNLVWAVFEWNVQNLNDKCVNYAKLSSSFVYGSFILYFYAL